MEPSQVAVILIVGVGLLFGLQWVTRQSSRLDTAYYSRRWRHVQKTLKDGDSGARLAIIDADKLVDHALKAKRLPGITMADRLRAAEGTLGTSYQKLWDAHKFRNRLVHEEVTLKKNDVRYAMNSYHKALKTLGAL